MCVCIFFFSLIPLSTFQRPRMKTNSQTFEFNKLKWFYFGHFWADAWNTILIYLCFAWQKGSFLASADVTMENKLVSIEIHRIVHTVFIYVVVPIRCHVSFSQMVVFQKGIHHDQMSLLIFQREREREMIVKYSHSRSSINNNNTLYVFVQNWCRFLGNNFY